MAALTTLAVAVEGVRSVEKLYHLVVDDDIDEIGHPDSWIGDIDRRQNALHPPRCKRALIELPSIKEILAYVQRPSPAPDDVFPGSPKITA